MSNQVYNNFKKLCFSGTVNLFTGIVKMMLVDTNYTFSQSHTITGDLSSEIVSSNYHKGGERLENAYVAIDTLDNEAYLYADDLTYTGLTATPRYGIIYLSGNSLQNSYLIGQVDFGSTALTAADLVIDWNSEGILNLM